MIVPQTEVQPTEFEVTLDVGHNYNKLQLELEELAYVTFARLVTINGDVETERSDPPGQGCRQGQAKTRLNEDKL